MIIRTLAQAVREQNWFTVAVELLVVVAGIYLGLQADAWNQGRIDDQRSQQAVEALQTDFVEISDAAENLAQYYKGIITDLQVLTRSLKAGEILPDDEAAIRNAIANGSNFGDPPPPSGTYRDLSGSGNLALIRNKELRLKLIEYDETIRMIFESDANINTKLAQFAYRFNRYATMQDEFFVPDAADFAFVDVRLPEVESIDYQSMLADPDFHIAAEQHLVLQISRYVNARVSQSKIAQIQQLIDEILGEQ